MTDDRIFCWMLDGLEVDLPLAALPPPEVMVSALARMPRWRGVWGRPFTVAAHSVLVSMLAPEGHRLAALLHDYHEAIAGDPPSPVMRYQRKLNGGAPHPHDLMCAEIDRLVERDFGLPFGAMHSPEVKAADMLAACAEAAATGVAPLAKVKKFFGPDRWDAMLQAMTDLEIADVVNTGHFGYGAERLFLHRLRALQTGAIAP